jgi:hypothetical protein
LESDSKIQSRRLIFINLLTKKKISSWRNIAFVANNQSIARIPDRAFRKAELGSGFQYWNPRSNVGQRLELNSNVGQHWNILLE